MTTNRMPRWAGRRRADERGDALIMALFIVLFLSLIGAALVAYTSTSRRAETAYGDQRAERYAGDSAIESAINWASNNPDVAVDPDLSEFVPPCAHKVGTDVGPVTVTCEAADDSGKPAEGGLLPPEALLLTGRRVDWDTVNGVRNEQTGPYNIHQSCKGWWDPVLDWFTQFETTTGQDFKETSALFAPRRGLGFVDSLCDQDQVRDWEQFTVNGGSVIAAGRIVGHGANGGFQVLDPGLLIPPALKARHGCTGGGMSCSTALTTRSSSSPNVPLYLDGTKEDSDPARTTDSTDIPPDDPTPTDIRQQWLPVGFGADGAQAAGYDGTNYPLRTTAYTMDEDGTLTAISSCPPATEATRTIVFLPGWYKDADVLNQYTAAGSSCADRTMWLAPDPGPDGKLLTEVDISGSYYMDFRATGTETECGQTPLFGKLSGPSRSRWCIGGSAIQNPRVVVGTPEGWNPAGTTGSGGTPKTVTISHADAVDADLSEFWYNGDGAMEIDGDLANYAPPDDSHPPTNGPSCEYNIFNSDDFPVCFSTDRSIRVRDFTPDVTAPPMDAKVFVSVRYAIANPRLGDWPLDAPKVEIRTVSPQSGHQYCGTFDLPKVEWDGSGSPDAHLQTVTIDATDAATLAANCGQVDRINGYEVRVLFEGNELNFGKPNVWLDGAEISYDSLPGASFPAPVSGADQNAKSDCDTTKPGAQLIFGGESHVLVADGSLETCAGAYPENPEDHQVIGVFAPAAVRPIRPTGVSSYGGNFEFQAPSDPENVLAIDSKETTINYGCYSEFFGCTNQLTIVGSLTMDMESYSPPSGYSVAKIEARVAYNPKNLNCTIFGCPVPTEAPQLVTPNGCTIDYPMKPEPGGSLQVANWTPGVLYDTTEYAASNPNCLTPAQLAGGASLTWNARKECGLCGAGFNDTLDGIELMVTLRPNDTATPWLIPQSGCIVAFPNYNTGEATPDCAVLRSAASRMDDSFPWSWAQFEAESTGRFSVNGTIYAPSSALDLDDGDAAYPLASRGAVLRHLRVSGYGRRPSATDPAIDYNADRTPLAREATFTACRRDPANEDAADPCGTLSGDEVLTEARVRFEIEQDPPSPDPPIADEDRARVPHVQWWSTDR